MVDNSCLTQDHENTVLENTTNCDNIHFGNNDIRYSTQRKKYVILKIDTLKLSS